MNTTTRDPVRDAADRLEDLDYHLARYATDAGKLARHLSGHSHDETVPASEQDDRPTLALRHQAAHQDEAEAAVAALEAAQEATADGQAADPVPPPAAPPVIWRFDYDEPLRGA